MSDLVFLLSEGSDSFSSASSADRFRRMVREVLDDGSCVLCSEVPFVSVFMGSSDFGSSWVVPVWTS